MKFGKICISNIMGSEICKICSENSMNSKLVIVTWVNFKLKYYNFLMEFIKTYSIKTYVSLLGRYGKAMFTFYKCI